MTIGFHNENQGLTDPQFAMLAEYIRQETGIKLPPAKRDLMVTRLNHRLRDLQLPDYGAYCSYLGGADGAAERHHLISAMTTNVTAFFRESHHFDALRDKILPGLVAALSPTVPLRLWSAACSSGEEALSLAITVFEAVPDAMNRNILILATDIDPAVIAHAKAGRYHQDTVQPLGTERIRRFFERDGDLYIASPQLQNLIRFSELNLHAQWQFQHNFDIIFCRNVVIYFDDRDRQELWQRFARQLRPDGHLFIGHSERLDGPAAAAFELVGPTQYRHRVQQPPLSLPLPSRRNKCP